MMTGTGKSIREVLNDRKLQLLLFVMLVVQIITAINQPGFFHPDQHFQIVEFSSYQLHRESGATAILGIGCCRAPHLAGICFFCLRKSLRSHWHYRSLYANDLVACEAFTGNVFRFYRYCPLLFQEPKKDRFIQCALPAKPFLFFSLCKNIIQFRNSFITIFLWCSFLV